MGIDFRHLMPVALVRLLNSTPLGEVVGPPTIYRQQNRAGFRIGDGKTIDLLRYTAWLARERHFPKPKKEPADYEDMKAAAGARNRSLSAEGRDIGELPAVVNADRKARAASDFRFFCEAYFPDTFTLPWSPDHLKVIGKIEEAVLHGGLFAMAMPRGSGKTSICECACLWAILYGHREFVCLIGSDEAHAEAMLDSMKMEFEINDRLLDDFPEAVYPIQCLEGIPNRCGGQTCQGERTHMEWTSRTIVLPTIPGSLANGREFSGPVNVVRKATLGEISFVDLGADGATSASVAAAREKEIEAMEESKTEVDATRIETGTETKQETEGPTIAAAAPSPEPAPDPPAAVPAKADPVADLRAKTAAEEERILTVRKVCGTEHPDIAAKGIREGWDATRCELEVLRASRPKAPAVHVPDNGVTGTVLEAACMLTARLEGTEKLYPEPTLDAANKRFRGGIGLQELLLEAAWANGYTGRNFRDSRAVLRHAFGQDVQAGFSTVDIGGILSNVSNKFLLEGFFSVERTWRNICAVRNVSDFKTVTSYRLIGADQYQPVAPGGELKHGTLGEERYTNRADTFGLLLSIDRRDIINDDLGAVTTVPRKLGRGSGLEINDKFWATFLNNAAFFTAERKNYLDGADTVLGIDGLTKCEVAFMDQVDSDGKPTGIMPAIILVPMALSAMGTQLWKSVEIRDTTASTKYPISNPHQGKFRVEVSRYLSNARYTGNSAKAWYLLSDPTDLPVIEVAFLNGQEAPTIETAEADFNVLGIQMRGYHDFGCSLQDYRGGVKALGEAAGT